MVEQESGDNGHTLVEVASDEGHRHHHHRMEVNVGAIGGMVAGGNGAVRLRERERDRQVRERTLGTTANGPDHSAAAARAAAFRATVNARAGTFTTQIPPTAGPSGQMVPSQPQALQPSRNARDSRQDHDRTPVFAAFRNTDAFGGRRRAETVTGAVNRVAQDASRSRRRDNHEEGDEMVLG